jgi:sugar lactone lactonase YvrE
MPKVSLSSSSFVSPRQGVFDASGNFWVSDDGANALFVFNPAQLLTGGAPTPVTVLASTPSPFAWSLGLAFDSSSNLWVANNEGNSIYKFNASKLPGPTTTGLVTLTPDVILSDDGANSIQDPWAIRFDSTGNLWADNAGSQSSVVEFAKADLGVTGSPTPAVTLSPTTDKGNATLAGPNGLAFDPAGNLSVVNSATSSIATFDASQFTATPGGDLIPNSLVSGEKTGLDSPAGCAFGPSVK